MDTVIKRTLRSLCRNNGWCYGVFWRFDPRNSMLLTLEDAYYEEQMMQVIDNMLLQVHLLGEGIIGQAAFTGKHQWMYGDVEKRQSSGNFLQDDCEILHQFSSGIETVAVIPVEHRGVLQFGSAKKIMERVEFLDQIRKSFQESGGADRILPMENIPSSSKTETYDINGLFASVLSHGNAHYLKPVSNIYDYDNLLRNTCSTTNSVDPSPCVSEVYHTREASAYEDVSQVFATAFPEVPCISSWSTEGSVLTSLEPRLQSNMMVQDHPNVFDRKRSFEELINSTDPVADISDSCLLDDLPQWFSFDNSISQSLLVNSEYITDGYIPDVLGKQSSDHLLAPVPQSSERDVFDGVELDVDRVVVANNSNPVNAPMPRKCLFSELGIDELLGGAGSSLNNAKRRGTEGSVLNGQEVRSGNLSCSGSNMVHKEFLPRSQVGLWIDDSYSINAGGASSDPQKRTEEPAKATRKRARPGESTRPRPKDRQQIQDRLKELRGIIPNGSKCSIDALLDKTIKHMLFLQNVTKYADKLKQVDETKIVGHENGAMFKDDSRMRGDVGASTGGSTWAFEVGNQSMVCPIIVEDLGTPGQMLIEMLCEERGLFLEIADVVRGFGLNILKGVMEVREGKIWSHFIVEATRHVTRMDVFWSLVQLLQQTSIGGVDLIDQSNDNNNLINGGVLPNSYNQSPMPLPIS